MIEIQQHKKIKTIIMNYQTCLN